VRREVVERSFPAIFSAPHLAQGASGCQHIQPKFEEMRWTARRIMTPSNEGTIELPFDCGRSTRQGDVQLHVCPYSAPDCQGNATRLSRNAVKLRASRAPRAIAAARFTE